MNRTIGIAPILWASVCVSAVAGNSPLAASESPLVPDSSRVYNLDEVVVVSQPKETSLLRGQSLSSSIFTAEGISNRGIRSLRDLAVYVPSFSMPDYGSRYTSSMYIRGIGARTGSSAVGIYMDGMPVMSRSAYNIHTYQLDRVDVLRGPQGTLYGQNTEGGLVRMYSRNPLSYHGTDITLGGGSHGYRQTELAHFQRLSPRLGFSLAGFYQGQDGFFRNAATGQRADAYNEAGGKSRLVWRPTERWNVDFLSDYQYMRQNGFPYGLLEEGADAAAPATNYQGNYRRNIFNAALGITFHANDFDVTSTTSYQYLKDYMLMDIDYLPQDYMHMEQRQFQNAMTQEVALKSRGTRWWNWTLGTFFSAQWLKTQAPVFFDEAMNAYLSQTITDYAYNGMFQAMVARMVAAGMSQAAAEAQVARTIESAGGMHIDMAIDPIPGLFRTPQYNVAFFHESNFRLSPRLAATLGLRYDYSHVRIGYATNARTTLDESVMGTTVKASVASSLAHHEHNDFNQLLPKLGLVWQVDRHQSNVYATWSKGYRNGGYNIQMFSDILQTELQSKAQSARGDVVVEHDAEAYARMAETISYKPETSWNYEVGTHLNLLAGMLHLDVSAYYLQIRNQQLSVMAGNYGFGRMMVNAGSSHSCGIEAALRGSAFNNHLSWAATYAYTHAAFDEYLDGDADYADHAVPFIPQYTLSAQADYRWDLARTACRSLTVGLGLHGQGRNYWDEANSCYQHAYFLLDGHLRADFGGVDVNLWARNLTQTRYHTFAVNSAATGTPLWFAQRGNPFQMGADLHVHF